MIANDIVKDKGPVFFYPISRQVNSKKKKRNDATKVVRKGYLSPYSLTSRAGLGTMMQRIVTLRVTERVLCG